MIVNRSAAWVRLTKPFVAFLMLLYSALPAICGGMCEARICCRAEQSSNASKACSHCPADDDAVEPAKKPANCCQWIGERADPPESIVAAVDILSISAVLPAPIMMPQSAVAVRARPTLATDDRAPPDHNVGIHRSRAPPIA